MRGREIKKCLVCGKPIKRPSKYNPDVCSKCQPKPAAGGDRRSN